MMPRSSDDARLDLVLKKGRGGHNSTAGECPSTALRWATHRPNAATFSFEVGESLHRSRSDLWDDYLEGHR